jgi:hydrogenase maturation protease
MNEKKVHKKELQEKKTCIVGIGNTLRSDDGVGSYVCGLIEEKKLQEVTIVITQQLDVGITEDLAKFDNVIFIDASLEEEAISFKELPLESNQPQSFSHHVDASVLAALAKTLYSTDTRFYICAVGANNFEMGSILSEKTMNNALEAFSFLVKWINCNG